MENYQLSPPYPRSRARKYLNRNNNHAEIDQEDFYCKSVNMRRNRLNVVMIEPTPEEECQRGVWSARSALNLLKQERMQQNMANTGETRSNQDKRKNVMQKNTKPGILNNLKKVKKEPITESLKVQLVNKVELSIVVNEMMRVQPHLNALSYNFEQLSPTNQMVPYVPPLSRWNEEGQNRNTTSRCVSRHSTATAKTLNRWMYKENIWQFLRCIGFGAFKLFFTFDRKTCPGAAL